jgi:hypothetical protein
VGYPWAASVHNIWDANSDGRGAGDSGGRSSWTARPELADYVSFYGFMIYYLNELEGGGGVSSALGLKEPSEIVSSPSQSAPSSNRDELLDQASPVLVLGGYSYGSMITTHLPPVDVVLDAFRFVVVGSAESEVLSRASSLSGRTNKEQAARTLRSGRSLDVRDAIRSSLHCTAIGGPNSENGSRRSSRDSRRSIEGLRRSFSKKVGSKCDGTENEPEIIETVPTKDVPVPDIRYLLISPLLPPISSFATMFSKITFTPRESSRVSYNNFDVKLTTRPSLAIYGDQDFFTSGRKLRKWCETLTSKPGSTFRFAEIAGAGHFWHEEGSASSMRSAVRDWL